MNEFFWAGGMAALTQCYSMKGLQVIAGLNISNAICNLLNVVFVVRMGNAVGIIIGQQLGASRFEEAKRDAGKLRWFTAGLCLILTVILAACSHGFPQLYDTTEDVRYLRDSGLLLSQRYFFRYRDF